MKLQRSFLLLAGVSALQAVQAQSIELNSDCVISIQNQSARVEDDGSWGILEIPVDDGLHRYRVTCVREDGSVERGVSPFLTLGSNTINSFIEPLEISDEVATPRAIVVTGDTALDDALSITQLGVTGEFSGAPDQDLTTRASGTTYRSTNPAIATVSDGGLVNAVSSGSVVIAATNNGVAGAISITVTLGSDSDGDGLPDQYEVDNGLDPDDPGDALLDQDNDGLSALEEFNQGTLPFVDDTDMDGLSDGEEVANGTSPIDADPDLDGLSDGAELAAGSDPFDADTDDDGLRDGLEVALNLSPVLPDSDFDGVSDGNEDSDGDLLANLDELGLGLDPADFDTDGDATGDGREIQENCDPLVPDVTTLVGSAVDSGGSPIAGANVYAAGGNGVTDGAGNFALPGVPSCLTGETVAVVTSDTATGRIWGVSARVPKISSSETDVGLIELEPVLTVPGTPLFGPESRFPAGGSPFASTVADLNNDGLPDVVSVNAAESTITSLLVNADGGLDAGASSRLEAVQANDIVASDFDLDGAIDVVTVSGFATANEYSGTGTGAFLPVVESGAGPSPQVLAGHINADAFPDLVVRRSNSLGRDFNVSLGNGDGTFTFIADVNMPGNSFPTVMHLLDATGDGITDVVASANGLFVFPGIGDGTFAAPIDLGITTNSNALTSGRMNDDAFVDLVLQLPETNSIGVLLGTGPGSFASSTLDVVLGNAGQIPQRLDVADYDGDGILDVIAVNSFTQEVVILLGNGDGSLELYAETLPVGGDSTDIYARDLNADGLADIVVPNRTTNDWSVYLSLSAPDSDGDGIPDLFETQSGSDPNNPEDADGDVDGDGVSNLEHYRTITDL